MADSFFEFIDVPAGHLPHLEPTLAQAVRARWDGKTKPPGSLGVLESLAVQVAQIQGRADPVIDTPQILVFAGDHGAAREEGVSAYPQEVTWQMVNNFLNGGAAISVLARELGCALRVVDAGVNHDFGHEPRLLDRKVALGTANYLHGPAMSMAQCAQALRAGHELGHDGLAADCLLLGEMGIGNTASASLLMHHLARVPLSLCVGPGTGLDAAGVTRKLALLERACRHHGLPMRAPAPSPLAILATFGGFEIAMLAGCMIGAAQSRKVVVVDGFIACAAALVAESLVEGVAERLLFAHESAEPAHRQLLSALKGRPLMALQMRLGEASGAAVALPLLRMALRLLSEMATFDSAGVRGAA